MTRLEPIRTERTDIVPIPLDLARRRLRTASFVGELDVGEEIADVVFPPEWPADALVLLERAETQPVLLDWVAVIVERATSVAVGTAGFKGPPVEGALEIGYGINPTAQGRGLATEVVVALLGWTRERGIATVWADCLADNAASIRVLEKCGFERIGARDEPDGRTLTWSTEVASVT